MIKETEPEYSTVEQMLEYKYGIPKEGLTDAFTIILWVSSPSVLAGLINADTYSYNIVPRAQRLATIMGLKSYEELVLPQFFSEGEFNTDFDLPFEDLEVGESFARSRADLLKVISRNR